MTNTKNFLLTVTIVLGVLLVSGSIMFVLIMRNDDARLGLKASLNEIGFHFNLEEELKPKPTIATKPVYKEPEIGMNFTDFDALCTSKGITSGDDFDTYKSARGTTITIRREYTEKRSKNNCWGTFTFRDYTLESIFRR